MMLSRVEAWRDILGLSLPTNLRSFHRSTHMFRQCATMEQMKHCTYGIKYSPISMDHVSLSFTISLSFLRGCGAISDDAVFTVHSPTTFSFSVD